MRGKRIIRLSLILSVLLFSFSLAYAYQTPDPSKTFYGDANGDMLVQSDDYIIHKSFVFQGNASYNTTQPNNAGQKWNTCDVNGDNKCQFDDLGKLKGLAAGYPIKSLLSSWEVINYNLPIEGNPVGVWIPFQLSVRAYKNGVPVGRPGIIVKVMIAPEYAGLGKLSGRPCPPPDDNDQCAVAVSITDWDNDPENALTETGENGLKVFLYDKEPMDLAAEVTGKPTLGIPPASCPIPVNPPPWPNVAPTFTSTAPTTGSVNILYSYAITVDDLDVPKQDLTISKNVNDTCGGVVTYDEKWWDGNYSFMPLATGSETCVVGLTVADPDGAFSEQNTLVVISGVNHPPSITVNCPTNVLENSPSICAITASDSDSPQTLTCSVNTATTCTGVTLTGCAQANVPAQGEAAGGSVCQIVVAIADVYGATSQSDDSMSILEHNETPYWTSEPQDITIGAYQSYDGVNGIAADVDVPNSGAGTPGYLECYVENNLCSFGIGVSGSGAGAVECSVFFAVGRTDEICAVDLVVKDAYSPSAQISQTVVIEVTPFSGTWYVNDDASGAGTGFSWNDAFDQVQKAMAAASAGDQVWVAEGSYTMSLAATDPVLTMKNGVDVYGGFYGDETDLTQRGDPTDYPTILDGQNTSTHVIVGASNVRLDGFTVTRGHSYESEGSVGGGMYNINRQNITLANCVFDSNYAYWQGGAIYNSTSSIVIDSCSFTNNKSDKHNASYGGAIENITTYHVITNSYFADNYSDASGGAIYNWDHSEGEITNCTFVDNIGQWSGGGGVRNLDSSPSITNCTFINNFSDSGGAMALWNSYSVISNCLMIGNSARWYGGAIYATNAGLPKIINCTITNNTANQKGGGFFADRNGFSEFKNSIMWGNNAPTGKELYLTTGSATTVAYTDVQGGWSGTGNINLNPLFIDPINGDFHLSSGSPCINSGTATGAPSDDIEGNPRPYGLGFDMGAYEWQGVPHATILYVDAGASGASDGSSWANAFNYPQQAANVAIVGDEIWVAEGTYTRLPGSATTASVLTMLDGVAVYGGFYGDETELLQRGDPADYPTVLDGQNTSYHVVVGASSARLDGFTMKRGLGNEGTPHYGGGGLYNAWVNGLIVTNCIFSDNFAIRDGGGIFNYMSQNVTISNCSFFRNKLALSGEKWGGGIADDDSNSKILNCYFEANESYYGGAIALGNNHNEIKNCIFVNNKAGVGGAMDNYHSDSYITNCTFSGNSATSRGGGLHVRVLTGSTPTPNVKNCIFWGNTSTNGSQIYLSSPAIVSYSDIQNGFTGTGNISADPLFMDIANRDFNLASGSPCIDTGDPAPAYNDLDGTRNDQGAYGGPAAP